MLVWSRSKAWFDFNDRDGPDHVGKDVIFKLDNVPRERPLFLARRPHVFAHAERSKHFREKL